MKFDKKNKYIFYIKKNKGFLYSDKLTNPIVIDFPKETLNNLEVHNKENLQKLISSILLENNIFPADLLILLDQEVVFEKRAENVPLSLQTVEVEKFIDIVPFQSILNKTYRFKERVIIIAANRKLCDAMLNAFEAESFNIVGVVPASVAQEVIPQLKKDMNVKIILKKINLLKESSLLNSYQQKNKTPQSSSFSFAQLIKLR